MEMLCLSFCDAKVWISEGTTRLWHIKLVLFSIIIDPCQAPIRAFRRHEHNRRRAVGYSARKLSRSSGRKALM